MEPPKKRKYTGHLDEGNERVNVKEEPSSVLVDIYTGCFFLTGTLPKSSKHKKVNLG